MAYSAALRYVMLRNLSDLDFDISRSFKVKYHDSVIELPIYTFLLVSNSNMWPNSDPLRDISHRNLSDLHFYLSRSLKVKWDVAAGLRMCNFLLVFNSNMA